MREDWSEGQIEVGGDGRGGGKELRRERDEGYGDGKSLRAKGIDGRELEGELKFESTARVGVKTDMQQSARELE